MGKRAFAQQAPPRGETENPKQGGKRSRCRPCRGYSVLCYGFPALRAGLHCVAPNRGFSREKSGLIPARIVVSALIPGTTFTMATENPSLDSYEIRSIFLGTRSHRGCFRFEVSAKPGIGGNVTPTSRPDGVAASANITKRIHELGDWRGETLAHVRQLIHDADPGIQEEWKWEKPKSPGTPVWSHDGIVCTGESYKQVVKLTFARGASLKDPSKLFNSSLQGNMRRAIDLREGEKINGTAFQQLIRAAVTANSAARAQRGAKKK